MWEDLTEKYNDNEIVKLEMSEQYKRRKDSIDSGYLNLWKSHISQIDMDTLAHFAELLSKVGVELKVKHTPHGNIVSFFINYETFNKTVTRKAGRKKDYAMGNRYKPCTVSELKAKLESGMKNLQIIEELGCPKSTFYKILNNLKKDENLFDHIKDDSIWDYTS